VPQLLVDFSTIPVEHGRAHAQRLREATGCAWVDAPVSGGPPASGSGTLTVMAGGEAEDIQRLRPFMADVAARFTHMGPAGSGLVAKMLNQLIVGCLHSVMAEAASMAEAAGIDAARLPECLAGGHADGTLLQRLYPRMVARDFAPQGYARQLRKDLEMVSDFAAAIGTPAPMLQQSLALYRRLIEAGHSELDTSAVFKLYEQRSI
jgi:3-hydroxyisobutyrate dehydrogenase